eukprot:scaffold5843_cov125-Isochrysis_galbana.AAC.5
MARPGSSGIALGTVPSQLTARPRLWLACHTANTVTRTSIGIGERSSSAHKTSSSSLANGRSAEYHHLVREPSVRAESPAACAAAAAGVLFL